MLPQPSLILYMCEENGAWTPPQVVCEGLTPGLSPDGTTVLFSTWELWRLFKIPSGWTEPEKLGPHINFQKRQDTPYVSADGTLYFCSMFGEQDGIYRARLKNGTYLKPERLEYGINSEYSDFSPFIAPDESYLIFASTRPGYGITDLYISFQNRDGTWTKPKNMGSAINTGAKEAYPFVSFDGKYLFFMSNRISELNKTRIPDGPGNVFWVDAVVIEDYR
jgi:Tol biopolymer transport system component